MGKKKYVDELENLFKKSPVVNASSIYRLVRREKKIEYYPKQLVRNLILKGKIKKLAKGCYTAYDEPSLSVFCFSPSYLGLQDALSFHEFWEQETIPIIITSKKVRHGLRKVMGINVLIKRIDKKYIFGFNLEKQGEFYLPYSDAEKTFIDMIYYNQKMTGEVKKNIFKNINPKKLSSYLKHYPKKFREKVIRQFKKETFK